MKKIYILIIAIIIVNIANAQWQPVTGLNGYYFRVESIAADSNRIIVNSNHGVYLSTNYGSNWTLVDSIYSGQYLGDFVFKGTNIYSISSNGVSLSTNNGANWNVANTGLTDTNVYSLVVNGNNLYAGTGSGKIFVSTNNGLSWTIFNSGFTNSYISAILFKGSNIFAGTGKGVYLSTNNGLSWSQINTGLTDTTISKLTISGNNIIAGTGSGKMFLTSNNGSNWNIVLDAALYPGYWRTTGLTAIGDTVYAAIYFRGAFRSTDNGNTWLFTNYGMLDSLNAIAICGSNVFAGTDKGLCKHSFANFFNKDTVITSVSPVGAGTTTGDGVYTIYHPCTVKAIANPGYSFANWSINVPASSSYQGDTVYTFGTYSNLHLVANFNILSLSAAGSIVGDTLFCAGVTKAYHVPPIPGVINDSTAYEWNYNGYGASLKRSITGDTVFIYFSQNSYSGNLTVRGHNSYGYGPISSPYHINVLTYPNSYSYSGTTTFCSPYTVHLNINPNPYTTYNWNFYTQSGLTVLNSTSTSCTLYVDTNAANWISIPFTMTNMCGMNTSNNIQLHPEKLPLSTGTISGLNTVYPGQQNVLYTVPSGSSYLWTVTGGATNAYVTNSYSMYVNFSNSPLPGYITAQSYNTCGYGPISSKTVYKNTSTPDVGITQIKLLSDTLPINTNATIKVWIKNFWNDTITSIPVYYQIGAMPAVYGNWYGTLAGGDSVLYTFSNSLTTPVGTSFNICAWTQIASDTNIINDKVCRNVILCSPPIAGTISGADTVAPGQSGVVYTIPPISNATSYIWTLPNGASGTSTTNSITVNFSSSASSDSIKVKGVNSCGTGTISSLYVAVYTPPICSASFLVVADTNILHHYFIVNNASGTPPLHYVWSWGDGTYDTVAYPTHTFSSSGWVTICLSITDSVGSSSNHCDTPFLQKETNSIISVTVIPQGTLGINTNEKPQIKIYPNPTSNNLTIETNSNTKQNIEIVNLLGQSLYTSYINNITTIDVSAFAKGVYIIKLNTDMGIVVKKFIKQ